MIGDWIAAVETIREETLEFFNYIQQYSELSEQEHKTSRSPPSVLT